MFDERSGERLLATTEGLLQVLEQVEARLSEIVRNLAVIADGRPAPLPAGRGQTIPLGGGETELPPLPVATGRKLPDGNFLWAVPQGAPTGFCRNCNGRILWVQTTKGKKIPLDPDGHGHIGTCPQSQARPTTVVPPGATPVGPPLPQPPRAGPAPPPRPAPAELPGRWGPDYGTEVPF